MHEKLAPIIIFTYRRDIDKLIATLKNDPLSKESDLIIFSDGSKDSGDSMDVQKVRESLKTIKGFKSIKVVESPFNKGLARSIIEGVTEVIGPYGKVIVLEDDLVVSDDFLGYTNEALVFYKDDEKIWSIAGYGPKLPCLASYGEDLYLAARGSSWGWATWKNRWDTVDWEVKEFETIKKDKAMQKKFELGGDDMFKMLELQMLGKIDSWAIRWCFSQFLQHRYTVYPTQSKVVNQGLGDAKAAHNLGTHTKLITQLNNNKITCTNLKLNDELVQRFKAFHDLSLKTKIGYFLKKHGAYHLVKKLLKRVQ